MNHVREIVFMAVVATAAWALLLACCRADEYRLLAIGVMAMHAQAKPAPAPTPAPSTTCDNCNGTGRLGDGTVSVVCPECEGTGKRRATEKPPAKSAEKNVGPGPLIQPEKKSGATLKRPVEVIVAPGIGLPAACANGQCAAPAAPAKPNPRARWFIKR